MTKDCGKHPTILGYWTRSLVLEMPSADSAIIFNDFLMNAGPWPAVGDIFEWLRAAAEWPRENIRESPALVIGLVALLTFPAIAVVGSLLRLASTRQAKQPAPASGPPPAQPFAPPISSQVGILEFPHHRAAPYPIRHGIVRIGRETDNDVRLDDPSVHRYHAVIERTHDAEFHVVYVGDPQGNGVRVNGRPVHRAPLSGGEILDIGSIKLRFTLTSA